MRMVENPIETTLYAMFNLPKGFRDTVLMERWASDELEFCLFELTNLFDEVEDMRDDARPASDFFEKMERLQHIYARYHEVINPKRLLLLEQYLYAMLAEISMTTPNLRDNAQRYTTLFLALSRDTLISFVTI